MRRPLIFIIVLFFTVTVYYASAQQRGAASYTDLQAAWEGVKQERGVLTYPDEHHPFFSFSINPGIQPNAQIIGVGKDHIVIRREHSVHAYYQFTIPFNQIYIRHEH